MSRTLPRPQSREAATPLHDPEQDLIGYVLVHGRAAFALLDRGELIPADFTAARNRKVWAAIERLYCCGATIDTEAVAAALGYTATTPDGRTFPGVRWLHDYLQHDPPPPPGGYLGHPDYWPMTRADFLEAARILSAPRRMT